MENTGIKGTLIFIARAMKGDNQLEKVEAVSLIDSCFSWVIAGTVSAPIVQAMYDIPFISYAIAMAVSGIASLMANSLWSTHHERLYANRQIVIVAYFIAMSLLSLLPIVLFDTTKYYLLTVSFMMPIVTLYANIMRYPAKFIYNDATLRVEHDNRNNILSSLCTIIVGVTTIIYAAVIPPEYILRYSATLSIILEIIDIIITWKWLKMVDELEIIESSMEDDSHYM